MPSEDKNSGFGCLTFIFLVIGLVYLVRSIIDLKNGDTISFGRTPIQISPWIGLAISGTLLTFAIIGIIKIWKDKDKYPPL
jgi:hypothetical protein